MIIKTIIFYGLLLITGVLNAQSTELKKERVHVPEIGMDVDVYEVTVGKFRQFTGKTNYCTTADSSGSSGYYDAVINNWSLASGINWENPDGNGPPGDNIPVTQVSYYDACAYCNWAGGRLPTAEEWDQLSDDESINGNIWHGPFPAHDYGEDGFAARIAPVGSFKPNSKGLYDLFGNVWEWTGTHGIIDTEKVLNQPHFGIRDYNETTGFIMKGGSFLCSKNRCEGYYPKNYQVSGGHTSFNNLGFRCVYEKRDFPIPAVPGKSSE